MNCYNFKKTCGCCKIPNHWQMDEVDLRDTDFECGECKRIEMKLSKGENLVLESDCSNCNFHNVIILKKGMQFKIKQYQCPSCTWWDMSYGLTLDRKVTPYDYDKAHFSENL